MARFLEAANIAEWPHFTAMRAAFSTADIGKATGTIIFNIGGNKYRLLARVNFNEQELIIDKILTHEEYNRETL